MPELPEVETVMRGMAQMLHGALIASVEVRRPDLRVPFPPRLKETLEGARVSALTRRAKYIVIQFENAPSFILHLGMSGRVLLVPPTAEGGLQEYEPQKHDHLILVTADGGRIVYNDARRFGMVYLADKEEGWESHPAFAAMGPEPLGNGFSGTVLYKALQQRKSPVKIALLDQRVVAGLGNIYVCEALHLAGIDPRRAAHSLSVDECESLTVKIREILEKAIAAGGSTLRDHRKTDGSLGYFQFDFTVYDRAGQACRRCNPGGKVLGGSIKIERIKQGGRSTFFCPHCQK